MCEVVGRTYSSSLLAAPLHQVAARCLSPGLAPLTCTPSLGRKVVWKWPWTTKILECLCFVVLCDEGDVQTSESQPLRFESMRQDHPGQERSALGSVCPPPSSPLGPPARVWLVTFQAHPTCRSVLPPSPPAGLGGLHHPPSRWGGLQDGGSVPRACLQHVTKPPRGHRTASFGPLASHSGKGLGFFVLERVFVSFCFYFGLSSLCLFIETRYLKGQTMAKGGMCSCSYIIWGTLLPWMGNGIMVHRPWWHSPLALSLQSSTYCFSFQICDCTNSFHMKEFSLFK